MLKSKVITKKQTWEKFVTNSPQSNFLQSWYWGEFHKNLGKKIIRIGFYQHSKLTGVALLIKVTAKRGTYLECPGGPITNWSDHKATTQALNLIKEIGNQEKASFIRIRPNILKSSINPSQYHLIKAPMHLHAETTWILDLDKSEEDLLSQMRKNTRYAVKQANKLKIKVTTSKNLVDIQKLYLLQLETVKRKKFVPFSQEFLQTLLSTYTDSDQIQLFKASFKGQVLAIAMIHFYGKEAVYHYSGSSNLHRNIPTSYAIQWSVIQHAKKLGIKHYNFWGYTDDPKHRFFGPSLFKKGFGGYKVEYLPAHDLILKPSYYFTYIFETIRRKLRSL